MPLLATLEGLLKHDDIRMQVNEGHLRVRADGMIEDYCDGLLFKSHPLFSIDPCSIQVIAYYDEIELCNPLGTHVKDHKLGIVFFILGNVHPKFRSSLNAINLLMCARFSLIEKYGINKILEPFVRDLETLYTTGVTVDVKGNKFNYKGALLAFLADNLGSHLIGGFKMSFSFAFRSCRTCLVCTSEIAKHYTDDKCILRNNDSHLNHCNLIASSAAAGDHYSKTYGVNHQTCLLKVPHYSIFGGGLPHDLMHDLFEGVAPIEIKVLLLHCIDQGYFTYDYYQKQLASFSYGYSETDKPVPMTRRSFMSNDKLRLTASQSMLLIRILPLLIGEKIPEGECYWKCFLLLRQITDILLSPVISESVCAVLKGLIKKHHSTFVLLYGSKYFTPKFHFLIHYPSQILAVGPMIRTWTIRYEAKLNFFKQCSRLANFKNVAMSLANRHQARMCYEMSSNNLLHSKIECGPSATCSILRDESPDVQCAILKIFPNASLDIKLIHTKWVKYLGTEYKSGAADTYVILGSDGLDPVFAKLMSIIIVGTDFVIFDVMLCTCLYFSEHFHSYVVNTTTNRNLVSCYSLYDHYVYHGHQLSDNLTYISLRYYFM